MSSTSLCPRKRIFCGLLHRRTCIVPTWRGCLLLGVLFLLLGLICVRCIPPFLAINAPLRGGSLVIEGWLPDYALELVVRDFASRGYEEIYVTGGPLDPGATWPRYPTYAEAGAAILLKLGLPGKTLQAVPAPAVLRDRTYASAVALKQWLQARDKLPARLTIITDGAHARRSRLLYQKAFGATAEIGAVGLHPPEYDAARSWDSPEALGAAATELLAYAYARVLFVPLHK